jgi:hypothetical protein
LVTATFSPGTGRPQSPGELAQAADVLGVEAELDMEDIEFTAVLPHARRRQHAGRPPLPVDGDRVGWDRVVQPGDAVVPQWVGQAPDVDVPGRPGSHPDKTASGLR